MSENQSSEQGVTVVSLQVETLSDEKFDPFGQVIRAREDGEPFGPTDAQLILDRGLPRFYIMTLRNKGLVFNQITRHRHVTQCLAAVGGKSWYIAVAAPGHVDDPDYRPGIDDIRAFRIPGDVAIKFHVGTWHAGPFFEEDAISFLNLELADTNMVDHQSCHLDQDYGVAMRFTP